MRPAYLLPALLLIACSKPVETAVSADSGPEPSPVVQSKMTPEDMAKAMNIPLYPGATAPDGLSSAPEKRNDGSTHYSLVLATKDSIESAAAFYENQTKLPSMPSTGGKTIVGALPNGNNVIITIAPEAGRNLIRVKAIVYAKR